MKKITITFFIFALISLFFAELEISTYDPWFEISRMVKGFFTPDISVLVDYFQAIINTIVFAYCGILLGHIFAIPLAFVYKYYLIRKFCAFVRSIHEIFWAFIFLPVVGLNAVCGILAIAIPFSGIIAKGYHEVYEESDHKPSEALPNNTTSLIRFFYGVFPVIYGELKHFSGYRLECALRSSAVLGFIGLPTIGFHLETFFKESMYSEASILLFAFYILILLVKYGNNEKTVPIMFIISVLAISKDISFRMENIIRTFTYEILPWPMRRTGVVEGTGEVQWDFFGVLEWGQKILFGEGLEGTFNTAILAQISVVTTGVLAIILIVPICNQFYRPAIQKISHFGLIVLRTTPEYILAYLFITLMGPSMIPGILAITIHNGAIVAFLTVKSVNSVTISLDGSRKKINQYFYEVLPRVYGTFLANLFYRWEVIVRESAMLGILGIYTLGFLLDSAKADDKMDKVLFLILLMSAFNMTIDSISWRLRKKIKSNSKITSHTEV